MKITIPRKERLMIIGNHSIKSFCDTIYNSCIFLYKIRYVLLSSIIISFSSTSKAIQDSANNTSHQPVVIRAKPIQKPTSIQLTNKPLAEIAAILQDKSGIRLTVSPTIYDDISSINMNGNSWQDITKKFLKNYNYVSIAGDDGLLDQAFIFGHTDSSDSIINTPPIPENTDQDSLLQYEASSLNIPDKYRDLPEGSVLAISIPSDKLMKMAIGDHLVIDLPSGHFELIYSNSMVDENGDAIWVASVAGENSDSWATLTFDNAGNTTGQIITQSGAYNIDSVNGENWLVKSWDRQTPNLTHAIIIKPI